MRRASAATADSVLEGRPFNELSPCRIAFAQHDAPSRTRASGRQLHALQTKKAGSSVRTIRHVFCGADFEI